MLYGRSCIDKISFNYYWQQATLPATPVYTTINFVNYLNFLSIKNNSGNQTMYLKIGSTTNDIIEIPIGSIFETNIRTKTIYISRSSGGGTHTCNIYGEF